MTMAEGMSSSRLYRAALVRKPGSTSRSRFCSTNASTPQYTRQSCQWLDGTTRATINPGQNQDIGEVIVVRRIRFYHALPPCPS